MESTCQQSGEYATACRPDETVMKQAGIRGALVTSSPPETIIC
jgi:hypothetical protein